MDIDFNVIRNLLILVPAMLLSLTVHEYAHARTALAFGDPTAAQQGRVSLDPLRHLDLFGTLAFLMTQMIGWGKPVPVNPMNMQRPRLGDAMVSLAGPVANLMLALTAGILLWVLLNYGMEIPEKYASMGIEFLALLLAMNLMLAIFNLTPLFPLDGHHILREILPLRLHAGYMHWQMRYGIIVMLALWVGPGLLDRLGYPVPNPLGIVGNYVIDGAFHVIKTM